MRHVSHFCFYMSRILFFDTETTGLPRNWKAPYTDTRNWPRMVQLAFQQYDFQGNLLVENNLIIKPEGYTIPLDATRIHRITTERAIAEGEDLEEALLIFETLLQNSTLLVGHNISFDLNIIGAEFVRKNINPQQLFRKKHFCTMRNTVRYGQKWMKLSDLHFRLFHQPFAEAHDASVDVAITAKCFWELMNRGVLKAN